MVGRTHQAKTNDQGPTTTDTPLGIITPTRRTSAGWTFSGQHISGSTAPRSGATSLTSGGDAATSTTKARQKTVVLEQLRRESNLWPKSKSHLPKDVRAARFATIVPPNPFAWFNATAAIASASLARRLWRRSLCQLNR